MYLIYVDELKLHPPKQPFQWLCGLAFPPEILLEIESKLASIAQSYFGDSLLSKKTEFHAKEILHGNSQYKGDSIEKRLTLFKSLLQTIDDSQGKIKKIEVRIDPTLIRFPKDIAEQAFMFFVEKCDYLMKSLNDVGLLIADSDPQKNSANVKNLSFYKTYSTDYEFSRRIEHLVDTVHHTNSHNSRFLQLADIYTYSCSLCSCVQDKYPQMNLREYIIKTTSVFKPDTYKYWPTPQSNWLR